MGRKPGFAMAPSAWLVPNHLDWSLKIDPFNFKLSGRRNRPRTLPTGMATSTGPASRGSGLFRPALLGLALILFSTAWLGLTHSELPTRLPGGEGGAVTLGTGGYDMEPLQAPAASGTLLRVLTWFLTSTRLGPPVRRYLLNNNRPHQHLRELASQAGMYPPMYYPVHRATPAEHKEHAARAARASLNDTLKNGFSLARGRPVTENPRFWSVEDYAAAYRSGAASPVDVISRSLEAALNTRGVFAWIKPDAVRAQAAASAARWAANAPLSVLDGVPVGIKDMLAIKDHAAFCGMFPSDKRKSELQTQDDVLVARLRAAGAIILGSTTMTEGGVTPLGFAEFFDGPENAYSAGYYPGGSSSGSATAVAMGIVPIAIGFDGGGSIRIPASLSGTVGLASTYGRVPFSQQMATTSMIKSGVLAATARDAAITHAVISPNEPDHFFTALYGGDGPPDAHLDGFARAQGDTALDGVSIGIFRAQAADADPVVRAACDKAVQFLVSRGARIVDIVIPHMQALSLAHGLKISSEFALGFDVPYDNFPNEIEPALGHNTRVTIAIGKTVSALEAIAGERLRRWAFEYVRGLYEEHNLTAIVGPTVALTAPPIVPGDRVTGRYDASLVVRMMRHIFLANLLGLPAVSVPVGYEEETGLPIGLQFLGTHWSEAKLLELARFVEEEFTERRVPYSFVDVLRA